MNAVAIGDKLRKLRGDRSQQEVSESVGISKSALAMYERGERIPRDEVKIRLSHFYGISLETLFFAN